METEGPWKGTDGPVSRPPFNCTTPFQLHNCSFYGLVVICGPVRAGGLETPHGASRKMRTLRGLWEAHLIFLCNWEWRGGQTLPLRASPQPLSVQFSTITFILQRHSRRILSMRAQHSKAAAQALSLSDAAPCMCTAFGSRESRSWIRCA